VPCRPGANELAHRLDVGQFAVELLGLAVLGRLTEAGVRRGNGRRDPICAIRITARWLLSDRTRPHGDGVPHMACAGYMLEKHAHYKKPFSCHLTPFVLD
jgi:hypothetical protein